MGDEGIYSATRLQLWLYRRWQMFCRTVLNGEKFVLVLLGDLVDGARQHGTFQTWGTQAAQNAAAVDLLHPLANAAYVIYGVKGTECHGGAAGQDDAFVIKELGGKPDYRWRLEIDGQLFDVAHHARRDSGETTLGNSCMSILRQTRLRCARTGERPPDYVVRAHGHGYDQLDHRGMTAALCPGWKLQDEYTRKLNAASLADVGGLIWDDGKLTPHLYPPAPDKITVVPSPK
jgi:hypothetical protein